ncbi:tripartite tricarboxylate transporter substrate-binding protein [Polaromonas sp.]|uniref:tripartite tricarboxylate transporter substrate-binding protein n=1 Tax=Polaromonas sp. TaxID=1869339 RepID=UPI003BA8D07C
MTKRRIFMAGAMSGLLLPSIHAQTGTNTRIRNLRVLCGFPPGGATDAVSRRVSDKLQGSYADVSLVDNRPGAAGRIAIDELKRSKPDGSTMLLTPAAVITLFPHIYEGINYKTDDFTPTSTACQVQFGFGVGPGVPSSVTDINSYLRWAKANSGAASYGSPATGSLPHILGVLLANQSRVALNHIPYKGSAPGMSDLLGGQVPAFSGLLGDWLPHIKTGKARLLATSGKERSALTPNVPTFAELGFKDLVMSEWYGFFLPKGATKETANAAADAIAKAVRQKDVIDAFAQLGLEASASTPTELGIRMKEEFRLWETTVQKLGIKIEI